MKTFRKHILTLGISCLGLTLAGVTSAALATSNDATPAPAAPADSAPAAQANGDFPPQPVSVAPAENAPVAADTAAQATDAPAPTANNVPAAPADKALIPVPQGADGAVKGTNVMGDSGAVQKHSGTYYDSTAIVPDRDLAAVGATGPRKIDPALEPGQTYVVVDKVGKASSYESQYVAATRALKLGRYAAAMEMFEKLYKKNNKDPRILMGLAVAQQGAGFRESAVSTYEDLLKVQPNNANAIVNLMGIMRSQYPSVTLKKLTELRGKYPNNAGIPAQMGLINADLNNYDDALRNLEIAASMEPTNSTHVYNMAIVTDRKGDVSRAIKLYEQALQLDATYGDSASGLPREQIYDRLVVLRRKV